MLNEVAGLEEVAAQLGRSAAWLRRHWLRLSRDEGFPRKLPTGWVWPREAVRLWLRAGGFATPQPAPVNDNLLSDPRAAFRAAMSERYGVEQ